MTTLKKHYWAIIPIVGWLVIRFGFGFNGLYGQDAYAYLLHAREWRDFFLGGEIPGSFFWPPNYSIISALLALLVKTEFYSLQLVSVLSMIGLGWILDSWIKKTHQETNETTRMAFVSIAFLLSPFMFRLGMQSMSDMLAMLFLTASFYYLSLYFQTDRIQPLLSWAAFSALAITTRYPAIVVLLPTISFIGFRLLSRSQFKRLITGLLVGLILIFTAVYWKLNTGGIESGIQTVILHDWSFSNFLGTEFHRADTNSSFLLPNVLFNLSVFSHPGTFFCGIALLPFSVKGLKTNTFGLLLLGSIIIYALFLAGIPFQNSRVMSFAFPLVVMFFFPAFLRLILLFNSKQIPVKIVLTVCFLVQITLSARAMQPSVLNCQFEDELVNYVSKEFPNQTVYTSSYSQLFEVFETGNPVHQIFDEPVNSFQNSSIFIFNESLVEFKLQGTMPLQNWESVNRLMKVEKQKCWSNGWCVYSVKSL
jgi:hypothetical protein